MRGKSRNLTPPREFFPPSNVGHCSHRGTGLLSAVTYRATPVLRTAATTEVAGDPCDEADVVTLVNEPYLLLKNSDKIYNYSQFLVIHIRSQDVIGPTER